jgi:acyl carrier protein
MKTQFIEKLAEILEIEVDNISTDSNFRELDNWDSLASLSLSAMINEDFDITIPRTEFEKLITVDDLISYIKSKK